MNNSCIEDMSETEIRQEIAKLDKLRRDGELTPRMARQLSALMRALGEIETSRFKKW